MSLVFGFLMMVGLAHAQTPADCPDAVERREGTQIQQQWSDGSQTCFLSVSPLDGYVDLTYRDHLFTSDGLFMVFNSFGQGPDSGTTAAREFYMFPRTQSKMTYSWDDDEKELTVTHITGDKFVFDSRKARLKSMSRAQVTVADYVEPQNRGGIEITNYQALLLDGGFQMGNAPTADPNGKSKFIDAKGVSCQIGNREIFKYTSDGDVILKHSDKSLWTLLKSRCPKLKLP